MNADCIASIFTAEATVGVKSSITDVELVLGILLRAQMPPELLAFAFNILRSIQSRNAPQRYFRAAPPDLLAVSALSLACTYSNDHPMSFAEWSRNICDGMWTAKRIDRTVMRVLTLLDWRLHELSSPTSLQVAVDLIYSRAPEEGTKPSLAPETNSHASDVEPSMKVAPRLAIEGISTCWNNGQNAAMLSSGLGRRALPAFTLMLRVIYWRLIAGLCLFLISERIGSS